MAKIRGNKYISVEERNALDDISEIRNANVSLGTKLYDLTNQLASEIEGEPISESFPKSVHDLEDHSSIPGVPAAEIFTEEVHDLLDHTGLTGVGYNVWYDSLVDLQASTSDYSYGAVYFVWDEKSFYYYDDDTDPENAVWVKLAPLQAANQPVSSAIDITGIVSDFNALLAKLKAAGMMAPDA